MTVVLGGRAFEEGVDCTPADVVAALEAGDRATTAHPSPARLLALKREHWAIENRLHWVRDVSMDEDRCRVRAGGRALASIRNLGLSLIRARGLSVREARENFREDRAEAIAAVTGRIL